MNNEKQELYSNMIRDLLGISIPPEKINEKVEIELHDFIIQVSTCSEIISSSFEYLVSILPVLWASADLLLEAHDILEAVAEFEGELQGAKKGFIGCYFALKNQYAQRIEGAVAGIKVFN
ncbi:hypothetical protein ACHJH3_11155 [Campylobacter sp. MOP7]|uniref:hypothetical protein n=1 Tax=Campylobacter canis TaxID=3378588 RepID=UPI00387EB302